MSTGVGVSSCCLSGRLHDGKTVGRETEIGGLQVYVSEPEGDSKAKSVVFITDIFGWKLNNTRLLADSYAKAGFYVYVPDFHQGDSLDEEFLNDIEPPLVERQNLTIVDKAAKTAKVGATLGPWLVKHREAVAKPLIDGFINTLKTTPGTNKIGTVGFCWGARYSILAAHDRADAAVAYHPALVTIPGDFEGLSKPLYLGVGDKDSLLPETEVKKIQDVLAQKSSVPTEVELFKDQVHGFVLRGDWSSDADKAAMDKAEKQGQAWLQKYLS